MRYKTMTGITAYIHKDTNGDSFTCIRNGDKPPRATLTHPSQIRKERNSLLWKPNIEDMSQNYREKICCDLTPIKSGKKDNQLNTE